MVIQHLLALAVQVQVIYIMECVHPVQLTIIVQLMYVISVTIHALPVMMVIVV